MSSTWPLISPREALTRLQAGARGLDVRSEKEFTKGALPSFTNHPILKDEHRHLVGLTYKEQGQAAAIELGHQLVDPIKPQLLERWRECLSPLPPEYRLLVCWRGGLRSEITAQWLRDSGLDGVRVKGGYKAIRNELLAALEQVPPLIVLSGWTGTGKTEILRRLPPKRVVDLEGMARHRGSAFGLGLRETQPTQQTFENELGLSLWKMNEEMVVEDEAALIGMCSIPSTFREAMLKAPLVVVELPMAERVARIFAEYVEQPLAQHTREQVQQHLLASLERIARRLGGKRTAEIRQLLVEAFGSSDKSAGAHAGWIGALLAEYYDPSYEHGIRRQQRPVLFRGNAAAVEEFLVNRLGRNLDL